MPHFVIKLSYFVITISPFVMTWSYFVILLTTLWNKVASIFISCPVIFRYFVINNSRYASGKAQFINWFTTKVFYVKITFNDTLKLLSSVITLTLAEITTFSWKLKLSHLKCFTGNFYNYLDGSRTFAKRRTLPKVFSEWECSEQRGASDLMCVKP